MNAMSLTHFLSLPAFRSLTILSFMLLAVLPARGQTVEEFKEFHRLLRINAAEHILLCNEASDPSGEPQVYGVQRDSLGRPVQITRFRFGNLDTREVWTTMRISYLRLDTINSIIERRTFYNASGTPVDIMISGVFTEEILRRTNGQLVMRQNKDRAGKQANDTAGVSRTIFREVGDGEIKQEWFYSSGKQHFGTGSDGPLRPFAYMAPQTYYRIMKLDKQGELLRERLLNFDGAPIPFPNGAMIFSYELNDCGQTERVIFLDISGNPIVDSDGVASTTMKYDNAGRAIEWQAFDLKGSPHARRSDGIAGERYIYRDFDAYLLRIEKFDEKGNILP